MEEKFSLEATTKYADAYAGKVLKDFFSSKDKIQGAEILSLCNVPQVNLFVVKELFTAWKEETKKLKSPYFDYENKDVKEALDTLMSVLSKNILIHETQFAPLLKKAVTQTLLVIFNPYDFYTTLITGKNNKLDVQSFREEIKYLKINKAPLEKMIQKLEERNKEELPGNEAFAILDEILEEVHFTPEDVESYIEKFSAIVPLDPATFYVSRARESSLPAPSPFINKVLEVTKTNKPKAGTAVSSSSSSGNRQSSAEARATLADNFQRITNIKDNLTINQKFMFTKVLFHGDFELFSRAIDRLDQFDTMNAALRYIEEEYASTWDRESEEFHEFMELVEKRFA